MLPGREFEPGEDDQLWLGWKWFEMHAKQRLEGFKFFLTIAGALITVSAGFIQSAYPLVAVVSAVMALAASVLFWQLDLRSMQLIEIGETVLHQRWADRGFAPEINPVAASKARREDGLRFKHAFLTVFVGTGFASFALFVLAVISMTQPFVGAIPKLH